MRRWAGLLLAVATLTVAAPAQACACGGVVDQPGGDTSVSAETAVVGGTARRRRSSCG